MTATCHDVHRIFGADKFTDSAPQHPPRCRTWPELVPYGCDSDRLNQRSPPPHPPWFFLMTKVPNKHHYKWKGSSLSLLFHEYEAENIPFARGPLAHRWTCFVRSISRAAPVTMTASNTRPPHFGDLLISQHPSGWFPRFWQYSRSLAVCVAFGLPWPASRQPKRRPPTSLLRFSLPWSPRRFLYSKDQTLSIKIAMIKLKRPNVTPTKRITWATLQEKCYL